MAEKKEVKPVAAKPAAKSAAAKPAAKPAAAKPAAAKPAVAKAPASVAAKVSVAPAAPAVKTEAAKPATAPAAAKKDKKAKPAPYVSNGEIRVELVHGVTACTKKQIRTVQALGLKKIGEVKIHKDNPAISGMIRVVAHLVKVEKVAK